jgi:hypothetical protein
MTTHTRRETLVMGAKGTAALAGLSWLSAATAWAQDDGTFPRFVFEPVSTSPLVVHNSTQRIEAILMHPSLLPLRSLTGRSDLPEWMLWAWHHDTDQAHFHAWSAPTIEGPYTALPDLLRPSSGFPAGYQQNHFSSGDVVWDPVGGRLIASPHSQLTSIASGNAEVCQNSFLAQSTDGTTWTWLDADNSPRLVCGPAGSIDSVHTGYGRLLRDLDGILTTNAGRYWWMYRAQRHDAGSSVTFYTPALASNASLSGLWQSGVKAFDTATQNTGLIAFDSFLSAGNGRPSTFYGSGSPELLPIVETFNQAQNNSMSSFLGPGDPIEIPTPSAPEALVPNGASLIRHPVSRRQYLVECTNTVSGVSNNQPQITGSKIFLFEAVQS